VSRTGLTSAAPSESPFAVKTRKASQVRGGEESRKQVGGPRQFPFFRQPGSAERVAGEIERPGPRSRDHRWRERSATMRAGPSQIRSQLRAGSGGIEFKLQKGRAGGSAAEKRQPAIDDEDIKSTRGRRLGHQRARDRHRSASVRRVERCDADWTGYGPDRRAGPKISALGQCPC
jgi:hypothetical protein